MKRLPHLGVYISVFWICGNVFKSETKVDGNRFLLQERKKRLIITPEEIMNIVIQKKKISLKKKKFSLRNLGTVKFPQDWSFQIDPSF